ncbi:MAG: putative DNA binding domain-containing protein [Salinivirgaceae bacterium]|nr:putative DNA binding domain-containing protein [Salinivirgaceae bacterium]
MNEQEIQNIIQKGEGLKVEFKKATNKLPKNLFETVCAFLNREGGSIILGIDDDKKIIGVDNESASSLCEDFASLSNNSNKIDPVFLLQAKIVEIQGKNLSMYLYLQVLMCIKQQV